MNDKVNATAIATQLELKAEMACLEFKFFEHHVKLFPSPHQISLMSILAFKNLNCIVDNYVR